MKDKYKKENLEPIVKKCKSYAEVCRAIGIVSRGRNYSTVKKYINTHNIDVKHFISRLENLKLNSFKNKIPLKDILVENSTYNKGHLKSRILKNNLIEYKCICGNTGEWQGIELILQLDHINGVGNDNRIENLRFLCPNCHSQTDTFCGKNK